MTKKILILLFILIPINANALIEVDITRGNLNPLPLAVSPLSIDEESRKGFEKILKKENIGSEMCIRDRCFESCQVMPTIKSSNKWI